MSPVVAELQPWLAAQHLGRNPPEKRCLRKRWRSRAWLPTHANTSPLCPGKSKNCDSSHCKSGAACLWKDGLVHLSRVQEALQHHQPEPQESQSAAPVQNGRPRTGGQWHMSQSEPKGPRTRRRVRQPQQRWTRPFLHPLLFRLRQEVHLLPRPPPRCSALPETPSQTPRDDGQTAVWAPLATWEEVDHQAAPGNTRPLRRRPRGGECATEGNVRCDPYHVRF